MKRQLITQCEHAHIFIYVYEKQKDLVQALQDQVTQYQLTLERQQELSKKERQDLEQKSLALVEELGSLEFEKENLEKFENWK